MRVVIWPDSPYGLTPRFLLDGNTVVNGAYSVKFKDVAGELGIWFQNTYMIVKKATKAPNGKDYNEILEKASIEDEELFFFDGEWTRDQNTSRVLFTAMNGDLGTVIVSDMDSFSEEILGNELSDFREDALEAIAEVLPEKYKEYRVEMFTVSIAEDDVDIYFEVYEKPKKKQKKTEIPF